MKKNNKKSKMLLIVIGIIVVICIGIFLFRNNINNNQELQQKEEVLYVESEDGTKTNVSEKLSQDKVIDGLKIHNIELIYKENISYLKAHIENTNSEKAGNFSIKIKLIDEKGQEIITVGGYIPEVEAGQKTVLDAAVTTDIAGAYDFEVSKISE